MPQGQTAMPSQNNSIIPKRLSPRERHGSVLMVSPEHYDISYVINPFMEGQLGSVDKALARTQSSIAVSGDGTHWFLFNASPDLRQQINATPQLHPNHGLRTSPIAGVVLTNADVDHVAGLPVINR